MPFHNAESGACRIGEDGNHAVLVIEMRLDQNAAAKLHGFFGGTANAVHLHEAEPAGPCVGWQARRQGIDGCACYGLGFKDVALVGIGGRCGLEVVPIFRTGR